MAADKVRIQGFQYDQGSVSLKIRNMPIYGFTNITWGQKRERVKSVQSGKDRAPKGRTRGKYTTDPLKITVRRDTAMQIELMLAEASPDGETSGDVEDSTSVLQYVEDESNQAPITITFDRCALNSDNGNSEEDGPDMVEMEFDFMTLEKETNGKKVRLFNAS